MIQPGRAIVDVAFAVCTAIDRAGVRAVLTGGSAATVYAPEAYQSDDLDFVLTYGPPEGEQRARRALADLGFSEGPAHSGLFFSDNVAYSVEFPPGPLAVGDDLIDAYDTMRRGDDVLYIISPTDSVRNRLMWFYHAQSRDVGSLSAAVGVAIAQRDRIDFGLIEEWTRREAGPMLPKALARHEEFIETVRRLGA